MKTKKEFDGKVKVLYELEVTDATKIRFSLFKMGNGKRYIDVRTLYKRMGDEWMFTKKGFTVNVNDFGDFHQITRKVDKYISRKNIISKEDKG